MLRISTRGLKEVALVTGGTGGIGKAQVKRWTNEGYDVIFCGRNTVKGNEVASKYGAHFIQCDVSVKSQVDKMFEEIGEKYDRFDVLFNNAGLAPEQPARLADITEDSYKQMIAINLDGGWFVLQEAIKLMIEKGNGGRVVNMSSVTATRAVGANMGVTQYAAAKKAMIGITESAAIDYLREKIRVNCVAPTGIKTDMLEGFINSLPEDLKRKTIQDCQNANPMLEGDEYGIAEDDVTGVVSFLAGPDAKYVNGQTISICGGYVVK